MTFVVRTQDQPRRTGTVTALHRADMWVRAVLGRWGRISSPEGGAGDGKRTHV